MQRHLRQFMCLAGFGLLGWLLFVPDAKAETPAEAWQATTIQACQTLFGLVKPSTTEPAIETVSSTTEAIVVDESATEAIVVDESVIEPIPETKLVALSANPSDGGEWIEMSGAGPHMVGWHLEDAVGKIYSFTSSSLEAINASSSHLRITLNSARLNNGGDSVFLKNNTDQIVDQTAFGEINKDQLWIRSPVNDVLWELSPSNPPEMEKPVESPTNNTVTTTTSTPITVTHASPKGQVKTVLAAAAKTSVQTAIKTAVPKSTKKTSTHDLPALVPISMINIFPSNARIQVSGTVASVPKLLAQGQFVIQNADGRGLLVTGNTRQSSPEFGSIIEVTGTLNINDNGITLRMTAKDKWSAIKKEGEAVLPRIVDLMAPAQEDSWSLVHVTGTVLNVSGSLVHLDVDGGPLTLVVKPALHYRTERILAGDVVRVKGLLDSRDDIAKVIPRIPEEIEIVSHKQKALTGTLTESKTPIWMPFGAAGATIVLAQGIKQTKKIHEKYKLAKLLKQASDKLTSKQTV